VEVELGRSGGGDPVGLHRGVAPEDLGCVQAVPHHVPVEGDGQRRPGGDVIERQDAGGAGQPSAFGGVQHHQLLDHERRHPEDGVDPLVGEEGLFSARLVPWGSTAANRARARSSAPGRIDRRRRRCHCAQRRKRVRAR
jgi:hypothetical protein